MSEFNINKPFERRDGIKVDWWHVIDSTVFHDGIQIIYGYTDKDGSKRAIRAGSNGSAITAYFDKDDDLINTPEYEYRAEWLDNVSHEVMCSGWSRDLKISKKLLQAKYYGRGIYRREVGCGDPSRWEIVQGE